MCPETEPEVNNKGDCKSNKSQTLDTRFPSEDDKTMLLPSDIVRPPGFRHIVQKRKLCKQNTITAKRKCSDCGAPNWLCSQFATAANEEPAQTAVKGSKENA